MTNRFAFVCWPVCLCVMDSRYAHFFQHTLATHLSRLAYPSLSSQRRPPRRLHIELQRSILRVQTPYPSFIFLLFCSTEPQYLLHWKSRGARSRYIRQAQHALVSHGQCFFSFLMTSHTRSCLGAIYMQWTSCSAWPCSWAGGLLWTSNLADSEFSVLTVQYQYMYGSRTDAEDHFTLQSMICRNRRA
jgi:hypothetical protein